MSKVDYVLTQPKGGGHTCHWPGCTKEVPAAMWGCKAHWFTLPKQIRDKVWRTYVPGQEITKTPSEAYLRVAKEVQEWITAHLKKSEPH